MMKINFNLAKNETSFQATKNETSFQATIKYYA